MKTCLHAFAMCRSMFCAVPCLWRVWDEEARGKMLLFLPVVGLEIGALWALAAWFCRALALPALVRGAVLAAYPFLVTGFIHLDGFMDVTDAVKSCRDLAKRREILKDSHVGSFAVIGLCLLVLAQVALFASVSPEKSSLILLFIPAVSRCGSALAVTGLPAMSTSQYADQKKPTSRLWWLGGLTCLLVGLSFAFCGRLGFVTVGCLVGYGFALYRGYSSLEGMNGDIAGYALTLGELWAVAVYALI